MSTWLGRLINTGVTAEYSFYRSRNTKMLNILGILAIVTGLGCLIFNLNAYNLWILHLVNIVLGALLLLLSRAHKYTLQIALISVFFPVLFFASSVLYRNNMEFFILTILVIIVMELQDLRVVIPLIIIHATMFLSAWKITEINTAVYADVGDTWRFVTLIIWTAAMMVFLKFFKRQNLKYEKNIEGKNIDLVKHQQALEETNQQLNILNDTKEKLFSIVAHDVRSPIASLKTLLELFNEHILSQAEFEMIATELYNRVNQLQNNLDNLLHWSQSQMNGIKAVPKSIDAGDIVSDTVGFLRQNISMKNMKVTTHCEPNCVVFADGDHVRLILRNLLNNAIKFSPAGELIRVSVTRKGKEIIFSVCDRGTGIKPDMIDKMFNKDSVSSGYGTLNEKGVGLGLMLCKEFTEKNNGTIGVKNNEDVGCTFYFSLPAA